MLDDKVKVVFLVGFVLGSGIRARYTRPCRRNKISAKHGTPLDALLVAVASIGLAVLPLVYLLTSWLDFADYHLPAWVGWIGAGVFAAALWLLWRSHVDLGLNWSAALEIREEHSLVTGGVYGRIRHPMYAAHWLWAIAQPLLLHNWIAGPALLVSFLPLYLLRVPHEEQMMIDQFGEEYPQYIRGTGRIIPRWR
jgi:protein-S-isoprenylcysteine O-methyltransferase Ste14